MGVINHAPALASALIPATGTTALANRGKLLNKLLAFLL
jgi:hypothetical protein